MNLEQISKSFGIQYMLESKPIQGAWTLMLKPFGTSILDYWNLLYVGLLLSIVWKLQIVKMAWVVAGQGEGGTDCTATSELGLLFGWRLC